MSAWAALPRWGRIALVLIGLLLVLVLFPLRIALDLAGVGGEKVTARQVRGSLWNGRIDGLMLGPVGLGDVKAAVAPGPLLLGRVRLDLWRSEGGDALRGAWISGFNRRGIADVTGSMAAGGAFGPLPIGMLEWDDVTVQFAGETCSRAEGRLRVRLNGQYAGLALSQGLSGAATCDGVAVLFPLVSQTGMERLSLRVRRDGRYTAQIAVKAAKDSDSAALAAAGLKQQGGDYVLALEGKM
ncbi:MAG: type II secretion system protein N [Sphingobium sp.]